jgi:hypothetical protein
VFAGADTLPDRGVFHVDGIATFSRLRSINRAANAGRGGRPANADLELVDPMWIPLPFSEVTVKPAIGKGSSKSTHADENGNAKFWVETGVAYTIEAKTEGFNKKTLKHAFIASPKPSSPTAQVQIKLQPNGPFTNK